ncbi:hypothetical protein O181_122486, partial [Austropuccinia psidii MF-1]|nr:hypothetical protein [Austropuccinia psidii MF-1]
MLLTSIGLKTGIPTILNDNHGAVFIAEEAQLNPNSKHIEIRFQYVRDMFLPSSTQTHLLKGIAIDNIKTRISEEETSG